MRCKRWIAPIAWLLLVAAVMAPDAGAQYFGRNKVQYETFRFKVLKTAHFDIYYYDKEAGIVDIVGRMAERWYGRLSGILHHEIDGRQPIILYASHPDFEQTNAIPEEIGEATGGFTEAVKRRVVLPLAGSLGETDHVLGHELVHAFQFDITAQGPSEGGYQIPGALRLPLWFIEGMAEYLTLGPVDANTAMWIRDAAVRESLPTIRKLDNPRYFPYRYGHAFWAYVCGCYGDTAAGRILTTAGRAGDPVQAIQAVLGISSDELSRKWREAVIRDYQPLAKLRQAPVDLARSLMSAARREARLNIAPALSPDGTQIVFLSAKDLFSVDMYLADARTGKIRRRITRTAFDPHLESIELVNSAGAWSADGRRFAFAAISHGQAVLSILDLANNKTLDEVRIAEADEILGPTWSPDGRRIAFSAMRGGATDLLVLNLADRSVTALTEDIYADLQPAWSPDGKQIAFVTDRSTSKVEDLSFGDYRLALYDVESGRIDAVAGTMRGKQINPQWSADGRSIYFIADPEGIPDLYRQELDGNRVFQVSRLRTGVSGLTRQSPALSVAGKSGSIAFCAFEEDGYNLFLLDSPELLAGTPPSATPHSANAAALPPQVREPDSVLRYLQRASQAQPSGEIFRKEGYKARLSLDAVGQPTITAGVGNFGTFVGGGTSLLWSDMLGDHNLASVFQINADQGSFVNNLSALAGYENRKHRWNWGVIGGQVPLLAVGLNQQIDTVGGQPALVEELVRYWQINREASATVSYPFNRIRRVEFTGGYQSIAFAAKRQTRSFSLYSGKLLQETEETLETAPALSLATAGAALVQDQALFGGTGPVMGQRFRFQASAYGGNVSFWTALVDFRRYIMPVRPLTLAARFLHYGRYGTGAEEGRLPRLFLGYPSLVRGYSPGSFEIGECTTGVAGSGSCPGFERLFGSRLAVANVELRIPIIGPLGITRTTALPPVDAAYFLDGGVAWTSAEKPSLLGGSRPGATSHGLSIRFNLLGFFVGQISLVHPNDRPRKGWLWEFSLIPGF